MPSVLTVGKVVHYVLEPSHPRAGEVRPAIVVAQRATDPLMPNLHLFLDGPNDGTGDDGWRGSVPMGGRDAPGTWFWPPKA